MLHSSVCLIRTGLSYRIRFLSIEEYFVIQNFLLPEEIKDGWGYQTEKEALSYSQEGDEACHPFAASKHLTKIVIPFQERTYDNQIVPKSGQDVLDKLGSLSGEILLFLTHIKDLYWTDCESGRHVHIALHYEEDDEKFIACRRADSEDENEEITKYLKYRKVFDHAEMHAAEVSVVYKLNAQGKNINEMSHPTIWAYFPTLAMTHLPFLIHGSFETAVSPEKLMFPSDFNNDLLDVLGDLIADSMRDLTERKLITQAFLRNIILPSFKDESVHAAKLGLKEKITNVFLKHKLLPDQDGIYRSADELAVAVPFSLAGQRRSALWRESPVNERQRESEKQRGKVSWSALGSYCPTLFVWGLQENLTYIRDYPHEDMAKRKSAEILKLFLYISSKLKGSITKIRKIPRNIAKRQVF